MNKRSLFWISYSDLMTSLFFIMLVLLVLLIAAFQKNSPDTVEELEVQVADLKKQVVELEEQLKAASIKIQATESELTKIREIQNAVSNISPTYFDYNPRYKKHVLKIDVEFPTGSNNIDEIPIPTRKELVEAGWEIKRFISNAIANNPEIQYLLIIEGQASKDNYLLNNELSYKRALSLRNFWQDYGISFEPHQCEVIIAGSGTGGVPRDMENEKRNQRFLIHILPKPGIIK